MGKAQAFGEAGMQGQKTEVRNCGLVAWPGIHKLHEGRAEWGDGSGLAGSKCQ